MAIAITTTTIAITIATTATTAAITIGFDDFVLLQLHPQLTPDRSILRYTIFVHRWLTLRHTTVTVRRYIVTCVTTATPTTARCDRLDEGYRWGAGPLGGLFNGASDLRDTL